MSLLLLLGMIFIFQGYGTNGCLPRRTKELTDSYVPVGIQALTHYKTQLLTYYPYMLTPLCKTVVSKYEFLTEGKNSVAIPQFPDREDVCVAETVARINLFLIHLQREAVKQSLEDSQGLSRSVLTDIQKTSQMTAIEQLHYILEKLLTEEFGSGIARCRIVEFLQDLENPNSKLHKNFLNVKPINYLD